MEKQLAVLFVTHKSVRITFVRTCGHQQVTLSSLFTVSRCICLRWDVLVPNGYETPKLQCVVVLLRCNSYAIQSFSVPGVWVHVWDEEAFKKLSPSLLHQQACLVQKGHSAALLGSAAVCISVCLSVSVLFWLGKKPHHYSILSYTPPWLYAVSIEYSFPLESDFCMVILWNWTLIYNLIKPFFSERPKLHFVLFT